MVLSQVLWRGVLLQVVALDATFLFVVLGSNLLGLLLLTLGVLIILSRACLRGGLRGITTARCVPLGAHKSRFSRALCGSFFGVGHLFLIHGRHSFVISLWLQAALALLSSLTDLLGAVGALLHPFF